MCQSLNQPQHVDIDEPIRKRVRFTAELEQVHEVGSVHDKSLWYSNKDFSVFRDSARETCEKVHTMGPSKSLEMNAFLTNNCNQSAMDHWSLHGQSDRGFENFANPQHLSQARKRQRSRCIKSVMIAQTVAREQRASGKEMDVNIPRVCELKGKWKSKEVCHDDGKSRRECDLPSRASSKTNQLYRCSISMNSLLIKPVYQHYIHHASIRKCT
jgi:hypothetical protein